MIRIFHLKKLQDIVRCTIWYFIDSRQILQLKLSVVIKVLDQGLTSVCLLYFSHTHPQKYLQLHELTLLFKSGITSILSRLSLQQFSSIMFQLICNVCLKHIFSIQEFLA